MRYEFISLSSRSKVAPESFERGTELLGGSLPFFRKPCFPITMANRNSIPSTRVSVDWNFHQASPTEYAPSGRAKRHLCRRREAPKVFRATAIGNVLAYL